MRILFGALLALVVGSVVVAGFDVAIDHLAYLAVLVAGVVSGLLMRKVASGAGALYAKGALAALATAGAAVAGPMVATQWFQSQSNAKPAVVSKVDAAEGTADNAEGDSEGAVAAETELQQVFSPSTSKAPMRAPDKNPFAAADVACLVIGCLAAYQIGKGPEPLVPADEEPSGEAGGDGAPEEPRV